MAVDTEVAVVRGALKTLQQATESALRHLPDNVDARRLRQDLRRLREDIDLLCGAEQVPAPRVSERQVIDDAPYPADLWAGVEDEGVGSSRP